jgi:hypothetical protein
MQNLQFQFHSILFCNAQWAFLDHESHDFIKNVGGCHGSELSVGIIRWSNLNNICCDEVDAFKATDYRAEFTGRPSSRFGGTCGRSD